MQVRWKFLFSQLIIGLGLELFLNIAGLDDVADYSEFLFSSNRMITNILVFHSM